MNRIYTTKVITSNGDEIEVTKRFITGFVSKTEENNGFVSISVGTEDYRDGKKVLEYINRITVAKAASDKFKEFVLGIPVASKVAIVANVVEVEGKDGKTYTNHYLEAIDVCHYSKKRETNTNASTAETVKVTPASTTPAAVQSKSAPAPKTTPDFDDYEEVFIIEDGDLPF